MVKKQHKVISLVLCLMLVLSAVLMGTIAATAATGDTVYVRANNGWTNLYCYMWDDSIGNNATWPGVKMTKVEDDVYSYTLNNNYTKVIFNNGSNGSNQTGDLTYAGNGKIYDLSSQKWSDYVNATIATSATTATTATTATSATTATTATTPTGNTTIYLENESGWATPTCYMWNSSTDSNHAWPGVTMTNIGGNIWSYTAPKEYANVIFSNSGSSQTSDLTAKYGYVYNNSDSSWDVYDTSPLQVLSYTYEPSAVYVNADITLAATAQNKSGATVTYKFSVTNAKGVTSVISDYSSANTATWSPKTVGTYTINYEFLDAEGNTNKRTAEVEVKDDSSMAKPVIKSVLPVNNGLVAVNTNATVSVKAGGGKTGTNLLFYKYVVTNPDGSKNTPYYTLNNTYTFKPTAKGDYKVQVFVQGSDNSTVNKTYIYTAVGEITTTQPITVPHTTVSPFVLGDADGDGDLTIDDATYIQKYLASYDGYECSLDVCDVDGDGIIIIKDVTEIQKILAGIV